jgi:hypothetical protein
MLVPGEQLDILVRFQPPVLQHVILVVNQHVVILECTFNDILERLFGTVRRELLVFVRAFVSRNICT